MENKRNEVEEVAMSLQRGNPQQEGTDYQESINKNKRTQRKKPFKKRTTIYLAEKIHKKLKHFCVDQGTSMSDYIEELLDKQLNTK